MVTVWAPSPYYHARLNTRTGQGVRRTMSFPIRSLTLDLRRGSVPAHRGLHTLKPRWNA